MNRYLLILYFCLYLSMIGYGISLPVIPFFVQELADGSNIISAKSISIHIGAITAIFALFQMLCAPIWGRISDLTGKRKQVLLIGIGGYTISLALTGVSPAIVWIYAARALNGMFSAAVLPIAIAYILDVVPERWKTRGLAWHGTVVGLGVVTGPAIGSLFSYFAEAHPEYFQLISINPFSAVFFLASFLSAVSFLLASFFLPRPSGKTEQIPENEKVGFTELLKNDANILKPLALILTVSLLSQFSLSLFEGTFVLHAQQFISLSPTELGYIFMVCGLMMAFPQGAFVAKYIDKFGAVKLIPIGLIIMAGGLSFLMLSNTLSVILMNVAILALGMAIIIPAVTVLVSEFGKNNSGSYLGLLTGVNSLGQTMGPLIGSLLFVLNNHLPYLLSSVILLISAAYMTTRGIPLLSSTTKRVQCSV